MINSITMAGRLTRDPELRSTSNGNSVGNFNIACERSFKGQNDEKEVDFIPVVVWRTLAENCGRYLSKGNMVCVHGRLQIREYTDKEGIRRSIAEIVADDVQFMTPKNSGEKRQDSRQDDYFGEDIDPLDDDIPF